MPVIFKNLKGTTSSTFSLGSPNVAPVIHQLGDTRTLKTEEAVTGNLGWLNTNHIRAIKNVTTNYTPTIYDDGFEVDATGGPLTISLPTAVNCAGKSYFFSFISSTSVVNTVTINHFGTQTINGAASLTMFINGSTLEIISDGANWKII